MICKVKQGKEKNWKWNCM